MFYLRFVFTLCFILSLPGSLQPAIWWISLTLRVPLIDSVCKSLFPENAIHLAFRCGLHFMPLRGFLIKVLLKHYFWTWISSIEWRKYQFLVYFLYKQNLPQILFPLHFIGERAAFFLSNFFFASTLELIFSADENFLFVFLTSYSIFLGSEFALCYQETLTFGQHNSFLKGLYLIG